MKSTRKILKPIIALLLIVAMASGVASSLGGKAKAATKYTITYNGNGGKTSDGRTTQTVTLESGKTSKTIKAGFFIRSGYTQTGWSTVSDPAKQNKNNTIGLQVTVTHSKNITYYAVWTASGSNVGNSNCSHTDYTRQTISSATCNTTGLEVRKCKKCGKTWEVVTPKVKNHSYYIVYGSKLDAPCLICGAKKYIGDMSLDELSKAWKNEGTVFENHSVENQKLILTKWIYSIMERQDEAGTNASDVEAFVKKLYNESKLTNSSGQLIFTVAEYGKTTAEWLEYIGNVNELTYGLKGISGYNDLSVYSRAAGKFLLFVSICNPNLTWDQRAAKIITEALPITGQILEALCVTGRTAVALAEQGVCGTLKDAIMQEIIDDVLDLKGGWEGISLKTLRENLPAIKAELANKEYKLSKSMQEKVLLAYVKSVTQKEFNKLAKSKK